MFWPLNYARGPTNLPRAGVCGPAGPQPRTQEIMQRRRRCAPLHSVAVRSSVQILEDNRVKLTVELDEAEFEPEIDAAFKRIAREVRLPGFRPGRVPRQLLEARLGLQAGRVEALRASLPEYYARAVVEHDVDVIDAPDIEVVEGSESGPVCFDAVVEVRPTVTVSGYDSLRVEIPSPVVDLEEIEAELDRFRQQFAELSPITRTAVDGDHLRIDISCTLGGETIDGLTTSDYDYRLGSGAVVAEIDANLRGASAGDILEFDAVHPDPDEHRQLRFKVLVKEVLETVLPELADEFVSTNSEFATVEDMRAALHDGQSKALVMRAVVARQEAIAEAVAELVTDDVPQAMVEAETEARLDGITGDLERRGYGLDDYLAGIGHPREAFEAGLRESALRTVQLDLALRAVAATEGLEADDDTVDDELRRAVVGAAGSGSETDDEDAAQQSIRLREQLASVGRLSALKSDLSKRAALEWITERVELVDPGGEAIDPELLKLPEPGASPDEFAESDEALDSEPLPTEGGA